MQTMVNSSLQSPSAPLTVFRTKTEESLKESLCWTFVKGPFSSYVVNEKYRSRPTENTPIYLVISRCCSAEYEQGKNVSE